MPDLLDDLISKIPDKSVSPLDEMIAKVPDSPVSRYKSRAEIEKEVRAAYAPGRWSPKLSASAGHGALAMTPELDKRMREEEIQREIRLRTETAEDKARRTKDRALWNGPGGELAGAIWHGIAHPIDSFAEGMDALDQARTMPANLRAGEEMTWDDRAGQAAKVIEGALGMAAPLGPLAAGRSIGTGAFKGLAAGSAKVAAKEIAKDAAVGGAGLAGGLVGGTAAGGAASLAGAGPGTQALAQVAGGVVGGAMGGGAALRRQAPKPIAPPVTIKGLLTEPEVRQPVDLPEPLPTGEAHDRAPWVTGQIKRTQSSYAEVPDAHPITRLEQVQQYIRDEQPTTLTHKKLEAVFGLKETEARGLLKTLETDGWLEPAKRFKARDVDVEMAREPEYILTPKAARPMGGDDVEALGRIRAELGPGSETIPDRLLPQGLEQIQFADDAARRTFPTATTASGRAMYGNLQKESGARTIQVPETEVVFPPMPSQDGTYRNVPVSQALKELPALLTRIGNPSRQAELVGKITQVKKQLAPSKKTGKPGDKADELAAQLRTSREELITLQRNQASARPELVEYVNQLLEWEQRGARAAGGASTERGAKGAQASGRSAAQGAADAVRAESFAGDKRPELGTKAEQVADWAAQNIVNPQHAIAKRERAAAAAGVLPVNERTGEPLAAHLPTYDIAQSRRGSLGVREFILDHPIQRELAKLGSLDMMRQHATPGEWAGTLTKGKTPMLSRFEKYLQNKLELFEAEHKGRTKFDKRVDKDGNVYEPSLGEIAAQVIEEEPHFGPIAKALYDYRDKAVRDVLVKAGLMSKEQYRHFMDNEPVYVPTQRAFPEDRPFGFSIDMKSGPPRGKGAFGAEPPVMTKQTDNQRQAVDIVANLLHDAHQADRMAAANRAARKILDLAGKPGFEDVKPGPLGVELPDPPAHTGMDRIRAYIDGPDNFHDLIMPAPMAEGLRMGVKLGIPTAFNMLVDTVPALYKLGLTGLSPSFVSLANMAYMVAEQGTKSRAGAGRALWNDARYIPEWLLSRFVPQNMEVRGPVSRKVAEMRNDPGSLISRLAVPFASPAQRAPVPGRILKGPDGKTIEGLNLTAAFDQSRKSNAGGAQGLLHEGSPEELAEQLINPSIISALRAPRHPLWSVNKLKNRVLHIIATDELGRIADQTGTVSRLRGDRVKMPDGTTRLFTEEELRAEGARDAIESLTDFTQTTPVIRWLTLLGTGLFINPAMQSTRIHAKGLAGHRGQEAMRREAYAFLAGALGGYVTATQALADPARRAVYNEIDVADRSRGWMVIDNQQDPNPGFGRKRGLLIPLDGPMRLGADVGRMTAEALYGADDEEGSREARAALGRAGEALSGLNLDQSRNWTLEMANLLLAGRDRNGRPIANARNNAMASDAAKWAGRVTGTPPAEAQVFGEKLLPGFRTVSPKADPNDPFKDGTVDGNILGAVRKTYTTIPAWRKYNIQKEKKDNARRFAGTENEDAK